MARYSMTGRDGKLYTIDGPDGLSREVVQAEILKRAPQAGVPPQPENALERSGVIGNAAAYVADIPLQIGEGLANVGKSFTDVFGAGNATSNALQSAADYMHGMRSSESRQNEQIKAARSAAAKGKGTWEEVKAAGENFLSTPLESTANLVGSAIPFIGAAATGAGAPVLLGMGAVSGAGMIKGDIYDAMYRASKEHGATDEQAQAAATKAQEYGGENLDQIALGTVLGAAASATGLPRQIASRVAASAEKKLLADVAERRVAGEVAEQAVAPEATKRSMPKGMVAGAFEEAVPEAVQEGQEQYAENKAQQRAGYNVDPWAGVAGRAAEAGIASLIPGAYGGHGEVRAEQAKDVKEEFDAMPVEATDEVKDAAVERFIRRGLSEEEARNVVERLAEQKAAMAREEELLRRAQEQAKARRFEGIEEPGAEPDINAPGMQPLRGAEPTPPAQDEEEQAAMQRAYEQEAQLAPADFEPGIDEVASEAPVSAEFAYTPDIAAARAAQMTDSELDLRLEDLAKRSASDLTKEERFTANAIRAEKAARTESRQAAMQRAYAEEAGFEPSGAPAWVVDNARGTVDALRRRNPQVLDEVVNLHAQDFSAAEIAQATGLTVDTVRDIRIGLGLPDQGKGSVSISGAGTPEDAQQRAAFEQWRDSRIAPRAAPAAPTPSMALYPTGEELTPERADAILDNDDARDEYVNRGGDIEDLLAIARGEDVGYAPKYSRPGRPAKDARAQAEAAGQVSLFGDMQTQTEGRLDKAEELQQRKLELSPEERKSQLDESLASAQRSMEEQEARHQETLDDIQYTLRAQDETGNAPYHVIHMPEDTGNPYKLVAKPEGGRAEVVLEAPSLQDFSDQVYGNMTALTPFRPTGTATQYDLEKAEKEEPTVATSLMQEFAKEVDTAHKMGEIDNNQRSELLNRLYRPEAYTAQGKPKDAIAKLEADARAAMEAFRNANTDTKAQTETALDDVNRRLTAAVQNGLLNPARARLKSMVEERVGKRREAGERKTAAQLQQRLGEGALERPTQVAEELKDAPEKLAIAELRADQSEKTINKAKRVLEKAQQRKKRDMLTERKLQDAIDTAQKKLDAAEVQIGHQVERGERLEAAKEEKGRLERGVREERAKEREAKIDIAETKPTKYSRKQAAKGVDPTRVHSVIDKVLKGWKGTTNVTVVNSIHDIKDAKLRRAILADGATDARGFVTPDGQVYVVANNLNTIEDAKAVLFHESLGHLGLEKLFREKLDSVLESLYKGNAALRAQTDQWRKDNPDAYAKDASPLARAVEEVLAERSEAGAISPSVMQRLAALIRGFARRMGMQLAVSDAEVIAILGAAHEAATSGPQESLTVKGIRYVGAEPRSKGGQPKTTKAHAAKLEEADASMSRGARRVEATNSTYGLVDGMDELAAGHDSKTYREAMTDNWKDVSPSLLTQVIKAFPTSGLLNWVKSLYGPDFHGVLDTIDDHIHKMVSMKNRINEHSDKIARTLRDFTDENGSKTLADTMFIFRINSQSADAYVGTKSVEDVLAKDEVIKTIEKMVLENSNDKAAAKALIEDIKALTLARKNAVKDLNGKIVMPPALKAKLKDLSATAIDRMKTQLQVEQIAEMTARVRDCYDAWNKLGQQKNGQKMYLEIRDYHKDMFDAELAMLDTHAADVTSKKDAARISEMRAKIMQEIATPDERKKAGDIFWNLDAKLFDKDYFPLMREGDKWLRVTEDKATGREEEFHTRGTIKEIRELQQRIAKRLGVDPENSEVIKIGYDISELQDRIDSQDALMQRVFGIVQKTRKQFAEKGDINMQELVDAVYETYLRTTHERSAQRRLMHAKEIAGFSPNIELHFRQQATTYANQLSKLAYAGKVRGEIKSARDTANAPGRPTTEAAKMNVFVSEFETRARQELNPNPQGAIANFINRASFYYYLTSARTAFLQTFSIPMRVIPRLWRDYGVRKGTAMWLKYMQLHKSLGRVKLEEGRNRFGDKIDAIMPNVNGSQFVKNSADLQWAMRAGKERGILEMTHETLVQNERAVAKPRGTGVKRAIQDTAANTGKIMSFMFAGMENISRQSTFYMTFELALDKYKSENPDASIDEAREYALKKAVGTVRDALGDFSSWERPSFGKNDWTRSLLLFKMHSLLQTKFMVGAIRDMTVGAYSLGREKLGGKKASPEVLAEAAGALKEFSGVMMMVGMFGGLMGMPLYTLMAHALAEGFDAEDDDDVRKLMGIDPRTAYDADLMFRSWMIEKFGPIKLGNTNLADILLQGPISAMSNTELSSAVTLDLKNMWFRDVVAGDTLEDTGIQTAIANIAGASMVHQILSSFENFKDGDTKGGLTKLLPAFGRSWVKAAYEASEGVTDRKGNVIIPKGDITAGDSLRTLLGMRSMKLARWQEYYITRAKNEKRIDAEKKDILNEIERKINAGEFKTEDDFRQYWKDVVIPFNRTYPSEDFAISIDTVAKSMQGREKVRARTLEGMQVDKKGAPQTIRSAAPFRP